MTLTQNYINGRFSSSASVIAKHQINMLAKIILALCIVAAVSARPDRPSNGFGYQPPQPQPSYSQSRPSYSQPEKEEGMPFNFEYEVKDQYTGNDYSHRSQSDGHVTEGEYRVLLPDGRTQIVTYTADHDNGYNAEVKYEGEATYEEPQRQSYSQPQPSYQQPQQPSNSYQQPRNNGYGF